MYPYILILLVLALGLYLFGWIGILLGIAAGVVLACLIGGFLLVVDGGLLPRRVRNQTASDFASANQELLLAAYPGLTLPAARAAVAHLLEAMASRAAQEAHTVSLGFPEREHFLHWAAMVAEEQPDAIQKELARKLVRFVSTHPLWWTE